MWKTIKPEELANNSFELIGKDWMLVTAGNKEASNTMTASWGGVGIMWGKPVAFVFIRPQRYTKEFIDKEEKFTLTFFPNEYKKTLGYLGKVSGRDENKIEQSNLTLAYEDGVPYFEEANITLVCKKLYHQYLEEKCFIGTEEIKRWYPEKDYHMMYVVEIEKVMVK